MFMVYNGKDAIRNYHDKLSYERVIKLNFKYIK